MENPLFLLSFSLSFLGLTPTTPCSRPTSAIGIWDSPWMTWDAAKWSGTTFGGPTWLWGAFSPTLSLTAPSWGNSVATESSNSAPSGSCDLCVLWLDDSPSALSGIPHFQVFLGNKVAVIYFCSLLGICVHHVWFGIWIDSVQAGVPTWLSFPLYTLSPICSYLNNSAFHWATQYSKSSENATEISGNSAIPEIRNWQKKIMEWVMKLFSQNTELNEICRTGLITHLLLENENEVNFQWSPTHPEAP